MPTRSYQTHTSRTCRFFGSWRTIPLLLLPERRSPPSDRMLYRPLGRHCRVGRLAKTRAWALRLPSRWLVSDPCGCWPYFQFMKITCVCVHSCWRPLLELRYCAGCTTSVRLSLLLVGTAIAERSRNAWSEASTHTTRQNEYR